MDTTDRPIIIAHRGFRRLYPENTIIAFEAAINAGAHMIELDVTLSRDRKLIIIHDDTLDRTTSGSGLVRDKYLADIQKLDAGSWFDPRFQGERVPTLEEVLDCCGKRIMVNIEIKESAYEPEERPDSIERQVVNLIRSCRCSRFILISSFHPEVLVRIARLDSSLPIGLITEEQDAESVFPFSKKLDLYSWNPDAGSVTKDLVREMHNRKIRVFPYTVNSVSQAKALLGMPVDGLFTDDPTLMIKGLSNV
ncbi:MAG: glycerophosphodiester phosphodiesterase family protein [Pseudomonadota bacterium]